MVKIVCFVKLWEYMGDVGNRGKMEKMEKDGKKVMNKCKCCMMLSILT